MQYIAKDCNRMQYTAVGRNRKESNVLDRDKME